MRRLRTARCCCRWPARCRAWPAPASGRGIVINPGRGDKLYRAAVQRFAAKGGKAEALAAAVQPGREGRARVLGALRRDRRRRPSSSARTSPPLDGEPAATCPNWRQIGADALVQGEVEARPRRARRDPRARRLARLLRAPAPSASPAAPRTPRRVGKAIADDVVGAFIGVRGVSGTEIAFVSDRGGAKEIFVMDADGANARAATRNRSINTFPDWSPDGDAIVYTSYRYRNRPLLFLLTRGPNSPGRILRGAAARAIYRGVFDPHGRKLAVVMSASGDTELFYGRARRRRRCAGSPATARSTSSPSWSPDGSRHRVRLGPHRRAADLRDERRRQQPAPAHLRRLLQHRARPGRPTASWIAYETRVDGQFDIWLIDPEGGANVPLVTHPRSDEAPTWSPDSRMLAFSSTRRGRADIYVIDVDGARPAADHRAAATTRTRPGGRTGARRSGEGDEASARSRIGSECSRSRRCPRCTRLRRGSRSSASSSTRCAG